MGEPEGTATTRVLVPDRRQLKHHVRRYRLRIRTPDGAEQSFESSGPSVRVGSQAGNDLTIADPAVSRIHFEITIDSNGFRLRDLGSTNGTRVNGCRVGDMHLPGGARIVVGNSEITFEPLADEVEVPLSDAERFGGLIGRSAVMRELFGKLERVAPTDYTVLIEGESGTGKELVAEAIHGASKRAGGPFVVFDCAAVPANLVEAELFGHERGAFTGALGARAGCLQEADGGTLFLDEIGELPLDLQAKLLRVLEKREFRKVGGKGVVKVDVRVVAATNRDLAEEVNLSSFRHDLYYRLAVVRLAVPRLADRPEDIRLLVEHFVRQAHPGEPARAAAVLDGIDADNWRRLETYPWRGNVRELRNVIHRALALSGPEAPAAIQPTSVRAPQAPPEPAVESADDTQVEDAGPGAAIDWSKPFLEQRNDFMSRFEHAYVHGMLERHGGNISRAAQAAGLDRSHFKRLLARTRR